MAPFLYAMLFGFVYSKHSLNEVPIAIVPLDTSSSARTLVRMFESSPKLSVTKKVFSVDGIKDMIYDQSVVAVVVIPSDFTLRLKRGRDTRVTAYVNSASMVSANVVSKAVNEVVQTFSVGVASKTLMKKGDRHASSLEHAMPVKLDLRSLFNPSFNYSNFMVPGLLMAILQQVILLGIALAWTAEKEFQTLPELFAISRRPWELMLGKGLPYLLINAVVAEFYLRVLFPLNDIPMEGAWWIAIPFTFLFVATIVSWGMWSSALFKTRLFATQALMFVAMPSFILSGFTWPQEALPTVLKWVSELLPLTHFVNSFRSIYLGGAPLKYILSDIGILLMFLIVNVFLSLYLIERLVSQTQSASDRTS